MPLPRALVMALFSPARTPRASKWVVQLGELTLHSSFWNLRAYRNRYRVKDIIVNPRAKGKLHDIALLRLASSVTYSKYVQPICVLSSTFMFLHRSDCWVTGWGAIHENMGKAGDSGLGWALSSSHSATRPSCPSLALGTCSALSPHGLPSSCSH